MKGPVIMELCGRPYENGDALKERLGIGETALQRMMRNKELPVPVKIDYPDLMDEPGGFVADAFFEVLNDPFDRGKDRRRG